MTGSLYVLIRAFQTQIYMPKMHAVKNMWYNQQHVCVCSFSFAFILLA